MVTWGTVAGLAFLAGFIKFWSMCADAPALSDSHDRWLPTDSASEPAGL
jgi:hypothetical protein